MAVLIPLISTTLEAALPELLSQIDAVQSQKILAGGNNVPKIIDSYQVNLGQDSMSCTVTFPIETSTDNQGRTVIAAKVIWT